MHNWSMTRGSRSLAFSIAALLVSGAALTACSQDGDGEATSDSTPSTASFATSSPASATATPYLQVPDGVELTAQGAELGLGERATVAWEPRQGRVGVLGIKVTRLEKTTFKESFAGWQLDRVTKRSTPFFVRATITNAGRTELGGRRLPLYLVDGANTLIEASSFASTFDPCPSTPFFPKKFPAGARAEMCLVFLAPDKGRLSAVSFRPTQDFNPITWTGKITEPKPENPREHAKPR